MYNPDLIRPISIDPLFASYPELSPYQFFNNNPIANIDVDGLEDLYAADGKLLGSGPFTTGHSQKLVNDYEVQKQSQTAQNTSNQLPPPRLNLAATQSKNTTPIISPSSSVGPTLQAANSYQTPSSEGNGVGLSMDDAVGYFGLAVNVSQEAMFSPTFNTWMGKDFKIRSQTWGGNKATGGKFKYAKATSQGVKGLGGLNYGVGIYNATSITFDMIDGEVGMKEGSWLQMDNAVGTFAPPIISIPKAIGSEIGRRNAEAIEKMVIWITEKTLPASFTEPEGKEQTRQKEE